MSINDLWSRFYPENGAVRPSDGAHELYGWIRSVACPRTLRVLNLGAGAATDDARRLGDHFGRLIGADIDPRVVENDDLHEAVVIDGTSLPFPDCSFDMVFSDWTMEHVAEPKPLLEEVFRVLKPGGHFVFRTPNLLHYAALLAWATPHAFHEFVGKRIRSSVLVEPYKTHYRLNTKRTAVRLLRQVGFEQVEVRMLEPAPSYLTFARAAFLCGVAYERIVNSTETLQLGRRVMLVRAVRGAAS